MKIAKSAKFGWLIGSLLFLLLFCSLTIVCQAATRSSSGSAPNYLVTTEPYRDDYVLSQLFLAAFHYSDILEVQNAVREGMETYPNDFPRFMALTLELAKNPDSRLFALLAPLAWHIADPSRPLDLASLMELTDLFTGKGTAAPRLRDRIQFYDDDQPPVERDFYPRSPSREQEPPAVPAISSNLQFVPLDEYSGLSELTWARRLPGERNLLSIALSAVMPGGSTWGAVRTGIEGSRNPEPAFFVVQDGIISFALPKNLGEGDFYADQMARPHYLEGFATDLGDGSALRACEMQMRINARPGSLPPELTVRLEQINPGLQSDFICQPQCVLNYSWDGDGYSLSGKACTETGWGVWPYSPERYSQLYGPAPQSTGTDSQ